MADGCQKFFLHHDQSNYSSRIIDLLSIRFVWHSHNVVQQVGKKQRAWTIAERCGCLVDRLKSSFRTELDWLDWAVFYVPANTV